MAKPNSRVQRRKRESADRAMFAGMQKAIDAAHGAIWEQLFREYAAICGNRTGLRFNEKFEEAWRRSMLPNLQRDDMDADGKYRAAA